MASDIRALVVVGSAEVRRAVQAALEEQGIDVVEAASSAEAEAVEDDELSLAIIADELPDGSGYALAKRLRRKLVSVSVIILRSASSTESTPDLEELGIIALLDEPLNILELIASIADWQSALVALEREHSLGGHQVFAPRIAAISDEQDDFAGMDELLLGSDEDHGALSGNMAALEDEPIHEITRSAEVPPAAAEAPARSERGLTNDGESLPRASEADTLPLPGPEREDSESARQAPVECSVFCPPSPLVGDRFLVQVFVHGPRDRELAKQAAIELDVSAVPRGHKRLRIKLPLEASVQIELRSATLTIDNPVEELVWSGSSESVQFEVMVPWHHHLGQAILTAIVSTEGIPLGTIKFPIQVGGGATTTRDRLVPRPVEASPRRFTSAFTSYASHDRAEVLRRVQVLRAIGLECFQDVIDLSPGERWERMLYRRIDECDLFLLFWSRHAKESEWVFKEACYALARQDGDESAPPMIKPIPLERPVPLPPPELKHLHFNDLVSQLIAAEAQRRD